MCVCVIILCSLPVPNTIIVCACCYLEPSVSSHWSAFPHSPAASSRPALGRGDEFLQLYSLLCAEHYFCLPCWRQYLHHQLNDGGSFTRNYRVIAYECMGHQCHVRIPPSFAQWILQDTWLDCDAVLTSSTTVQCQQQQQQQPSSFTTSDLTTTTAAAASAVSSVEVLSCREKYESLLLRDLVVSHPHLRSCPTSRCSSVFRAIAPLVSKRDIWPDPCHDPNDSNTIFRTIAPLVLRRDIYSDPCHDPTDSGTSISHSPVDVVMTSKSASGGGGGASQSTRLFSSLRVTCRMCDSESCFLCGGEYHAPTDCDTLIQWTKKCLDDSETANYISAHTKDCPRCHVCIEKSGGCNHMNCTKCGYNFCWMCLGDWKTHSAEYYECSRYRENPNVANEAQHIMARKALKKYIFYYERWANHEKSLRLEHEQSERIRQRINLKVNNKEGTWIDWQYLLTASETLRRCRNTLKHTYPFAFYMDRGPHKHRKELFEYKQGLLEAEVENLSWKIEHAEISDRGGLEQKMDICEKHRKALLHEFFMP